VEGFIQDVLDDIASIGGGWLVVAAFVLALGETAIGLDLLVPGEVGLVLVGAAAERAGQSLPAMIAVAALGATMGDSIGWVFGRYGAVRVLDRWPSAQRRLEPKLDHARAYFERRGGAAVFLGRFVGAARAVVSVVAGMAEMPYRRFVVWNAAASLVWTSAVVSAGYVFGRHVDELIGDIGVILSIAIASAAGLWWGVRRARRRARAETAGRSKG
jgi:membrane protein DedA with SNARE-associated domain